MGEGHLSLIELRLHTELRPHHELLLGHLVTHEGEGLLTHGLEGGLLGLLALNRSWSLVEAKTTKEGELRLLGLWLHKGEGSVLLR